MHSHLPTRADGVSVVIATYNGEVHVADQLESIAAQTVKPLEILIGDDGSTDRTIEVVERFASGTDIPVLVTRNETRLGYGENFMATATRARGTMIAFSDQDDVWLESRLEHAVRVLLGTEYRLWISGWRSVDESLQPIRMRRLHTGFHQKSIAADPLFVFHGSRMVLDARLIDYLPAEGRPPSVFGGGPAHHDEWASFAAMALGKMYIEPETLMLYRRHSTAVSAGAPSVPSRRWLLSRQGEPTIARVTEAAKARASYLRVRAALPECADVSAQLQNAADYYEQIVPRLERRCRTRRDTSAYRRASSLLRSLVIGDYLPLTRGGMGLWNLLQDAYAIREREPDRPAPTDANRV